MVQKRGGREVCAGEAFLESEGGRGRGMCAAGLVKDDNSPLSLLERPAGPSGVRCQPLQPGLTLRACVCACVLALVHVYTWMCVCARVLSSVAAFDC